VPLFGSTSSANQLRGQVDASSLTAAMGDLGGRTGPGFLALRELRPSGPAVGAGRPVPADRGDHV